MGDFPLQRHLEAGHGVVPGDGDVVLFLFRKFSDLDGVVEHGTNLGVGSNELVNKHHLAIVVVEGSNLIDIHLNILTTGVCAIVKWNN